MSLPLGEKKSFSPSRVQDDEDMIFRVFNTVKSQHSRHKFYFIFKEKAMNFAASLASKSYLAEKVSSPTIRARAKERSRPEV